MTSPDQPSAPGAEDATMRLQAGADARPAAAAPALPARPAGEVLAGRYRIVRPLGSGGMGEVYAADDLELEEPVALKILRPEIAADPEMLERFRREIQLARKVTHRNVCRIFDLCHHQEPGGRDLLFLSMELLGGETLRDRLQRDGPMAAGTAAPILEQTAAALAAAHQAGIVHRDLKSANILLVPQDDGSTRAVVTDFGLARTSTSQARLATLTRFDQIVGTPAYMAPEQVAGEEVTHAADIYAFGIVMFEALTGVLPFVGESALSTAVKRLHEPAPSPRVAAPHLDPRWERIVMRCLQRDPADRFASAGDLLHALHGEAVTPGRGKAARRRRLVVAAVAGSALALVAVVVAYRYRAAHAPPTVAPVSTSAAPAVAQGQGRRSIAVLGFRNLSGQADAGWLSGALAEMLRSELAAGETLRLIPAETVARAKVELRLGEPDSLAADTLARVRANLGSDYLLLGSYTALGSAADRQIRLDLHLQDTTAGETRTATLVGTEARLFDLVAQAGAELRNRLGVGPLAATEASQARASLPATPEAARLYAEGVSRLRLYDAVAARELLERAVEADPKYPLAHAALAATWSALGYDAKATAEAGKAFELSSGLSREERLVVEGSFREATRERDKAVEIYRVLWGFFPDNVHYGLRLAEAQTAAGKGQEALATVEELRRLPAPAGEDPRIDLAEAGAAGSLADARRQLEAARRAETKGAAIGARLLVARARLVVTSALRASGDVPGALAAAAAAQEAFAATGDQAGVAQALNNRATLLLGQGSFAAALATYQEVIAAARRTGDRGMAVRALSNIGIVYGSQGDLANARRTFEAVLPQMREVQWKLGEASVLGNLATNLQLQGDLAGAVARVSEAERIFREIGNRRGEAGVLNTLGVLAFERGDLGAAATQYERARGVCLEIGNTSCAAEAIGGLADVAMARDDLAAARRGYEEALAMREQLGEKDSAASSRVGLAMVALADGRPAEVETAARAAAAAFAAEGVADRQASALALAAEALHAQGRRADAAALARQASSLAAKSNSLGTRLEVAITAGRTRAATEPARAAADLAATAASAHRAGMVRLELQARLAQGEAEAAAGQAAGAARLRELAAEAARRGFRLIARRANAAL